MISLNECGHKNVEKISRTIQVGNELISSKICQECHSDLINSEKLGLFRIIVEVKSSQ